MSVERANNSGDIKNHIKSQVLKNVHLVKNTDLATGKTGIVFFSFLFGVEENDFELSDMGLALLEQIFKDIERTDSIGTYSYLEIGILVEILSQYGYLEIETDDILSELDSYFRYKWQGADVRESSGHRCFEAILFLALRLRSREIKVENHPQMQMLIVLLNEFIIESDRVAESLGEGSFEKIEDAIGFLYKAKHLGEFMVESHFLKPIGERLVMVATKTGNSFNVLGNNISMYCKILAMSTFGYVPRLISEERQKNLPYPLI